MIASAGYYSYISGEKSDLTLNAIPNLKFHNTIIKNYYNLNNCIFINLDII